MPKNPELRQGRQLGNWGAPGSGVLTQDPLTHSGAELAARAGVHQLPWDH